MKRRLIFLSLLFVFNQYTIAQDEELCPPASINVFGGDQENIVSWGEPVGNIGCGNYAISDLPFTDQGNNSGMGDDWPVSGSQGEDVAYTLNVGETTTYDFTLCSNVTDYDTKLEIFTNDQECVTPVSTGNYNDDDYTNCPDYVAPYPPSGLWAVTLQPGQYYVVVDGYGGATGNYEISVSVSGNRDIHDYFNNSIKTVWEQEQLKMSETGFSQNQIDAYTSIVMNPDRYAIVNSLRDIPEECGTFSTYRIYSGLDNTMIGETTGLNFTHGNLVNGNEYCYYVKTVYTEGESEATETVCGIPSTFDPMPPTNVYAEVWDEEVSIYWTAPDVNNLGIPYYEDFSEGGLLDLWLVDGDNWLYDDFTGNPEPSFRFSWTPTATNYDQSLYSPVIPLGSITEATISFDLEFDNWSPTGAEYLAAEYKTGNDVDWTVLEEFSNSGDGFPFTNYSYNISDLSGNLFVRFHCYGATSFDINWWLVDNFSVTSDGRESRNEYDFLGYNVYVDGLVSNNDIFDSTSYTVYNLNNELEYTFGVAAVYEGATGEDNYESEPVNIIAQPVYVYGDVTGTITDPNGAPIDSVIVTSGSASDTTGTDGLFTLWNLDVGVNTVQVRRSGFYTTSEDVEVLAQADPTIQNFVMSPDMPSPVGLNAYPLDEQVYLEWRQPGGVDFYDLSYYDGSFEAQIGCGAPCSFGVRFTPPNYPALLTGLVLSFQGGGSAVAAAVDVYLDPDGSLGGPIGDPINLVPSADLSAPDELVQYQFDVTGAGVEVNSGDIYVVVNENGSGFLGIANDVEPQTSELYDRNWVTTDGVTWATINEIVGGDPGLTGNFGILAQFLGAPGRSFSVTASGDVIDDEFISSGIITNRNDSDIEVNMNTQQQDNLTILDQPYEPRNPISLNIDRDDLIEYRVYEVDLEGNETYVVSTTDTFATVPASPNYVEYCYNVSAYWSTDNYGELESRHSNNACTVPYALGDADFDSDTDLNDILSVVDFILEEDFPTDDEFRNVDVNMDEEINIADVVIMVDIIFGGNARILNYDPSEIAYIDLKSNYDKSELELEIEYSGMVRGLEFDLNYDLNLIGIGIPILSTYQEDVILSTREIETGKIKVIAANIQSGAIQTETESYLTIPIQFKGNDYQVSNVFLENVKIAGVNGDLIEFVSRIPNAEVKAVPSEFALLQNFPNPFNPSTEIKFAIPKTEYVSLSIYNTIGQKVRSLKSENMVAGYHSIIWDGTNDSGQLVSTGMYFYSIKSNKFNKTRKMLFLK